MGCEIQKLHSYEEMMMPVRLEKCKQTVPQLAHTVSLSEIVKRCHH